VITIKIEGATVTIRENVRPPEDDGRVWPHERLTIIKVDNDNGVRTLRCFHNEIVIVNPREAE
jgi:hypothetical protein